MILGRALVFLPRAVKTAKFLTIAFADKIFDATFSIFNGKPDTPQIPDTLTPTSLPLLFNSLRNNDPSVQYLILFLSLFSLFLLCMSIATQFSLYKKNSRLRELEMKSVPVSKPRIEIPSSPSLRTRGDEESGEEKKEDDCDSNVFVGSFVTSSTQVTPSLQTKKSPSSFSRRRTSSLSPISKGSAESKNILGKPQNERPKKKVTPNW
eukprot:CAMPEP_0118650504 /NCGR_PEP_ID=MMETSP0785-20121206/10283_1 /TAXON_ID=91992 /ORGANISM="Bolidomonas pacifica, Strain CCMP 1866" /LENGTH=207 /DNA_ID=CAMNT_0006542885 /DNA_START=13 /DNA_END=633 /DNA_ORIENTATION=-